MKAEATPSAIHVPWSRRISCPASGWYTATSRPNEPSDSATSIQVQCARSTTAASAICTR